MVKERAGVFYRSIKTRGVAECLYFDKTHAASFFERLQKYSTKVQIVRGNISIQEKQAMPYQYSLCKEY